jgi:Transposase IS66 family
MPLSPWQGLTRFLDDGRVEIDSNVVEREMPRTRRIEAASI